MAIHDEERARQRSNGQRWQRPESLDLNQALAYGRYLQAEAFHSYARRAIDGVRKLFL